MQQQKLYKPHYLCHNREKKKTAKKQHTWNGVYRMNSHNKNIFFINLWYIKS